MNSPFPFLFSRFPFYYELKIIFLIWLISPVSRGSLGSSLLYRKLVHPNLMKREDEIDRWMGRVQVWVLNYFVLWKYIFLFFFRYAKCQQNINYIPITGARVQRGSAAWIEGLPVRHQPRHADRHQGQLILFHRFVSHHALWTGFFPHARQSCTALVLLAFGIGFL